MAVLAMVVSWAWWTGRLGHADATWLAIMGGCALGSLAFVAWRLLAQAKKAALAMGTVEVDPVGMRWRRGDGSTGFDVPWSTVVGAALDLRHRQLVLQRRDAGPVLFSGVAGHVDLARFAELERAVAARVSVQRHTGSMDEPAARRTLGWGAVTTVVGIGLYAANQALAVLLDWNRFLMPMPALATGLGLLTVVAGVRIGRGKGPMVSQMYHPGFARIILRFVVVVVIANFALVAVLNAAALRPPG